jgi:hypothetical protein
MFPFKNKMTITTDNRKIVFDDRLRFATKVMIQQMIIEKMAFIADSPEMLTTMTESDDVFQLFDLGEWYKILSMQCKDKIETDEFYKLPSDEIEALKKKWNLPSVSAEMRSEFIKNYSIRIKHSLDNLLTMRPKQAD